MSYASLIRAAYVMPDMVVAAYLSDLSDQELLVRPHAGMNHIAWQLGHLIASENFHMTSVRPGSMPELPESFKANHSKETAASDDPARFCSKAEYLELMQQQRQGTFALLDSLSEEEFLAPAPQAVSYLGPTVSSVFTGETSHWMMHAGQWAVVRRSLGKPPLF